MSERNDGGPTFPVQSATNDGVTLRDYFAAKAMQGMISATYNPSQNTMTEDIALEAYAMADAMLAEREK
jgi:hypothetical protein